jgi:ankyrin repeat protein
MSKAVFNRIFKQATQTNNFDAVIILLQRPYIDPTGNRSYALFWSVDNNRADLIELLFQNRHVDKIPAEHIELSFKKAYENGYGRIVDCLLRSTNIDPSKYHNNAFQYMYAYGFYDIADQIARDPRSTIRNMDYCGALSIAVRKGNLDIVKYILSSSNNRINNVMDGLHYVDWFHMILCACFDGHLEIVEFMLSVKDLETHIDLENMLEDSASAGHLHLVTWILDNKFQKDETISSNALTDAVAKGHHTVVERLLEDPRVSREGFILSCAVINKHTHILELVMKDDYISKKVNDHEEYLKTKTNEELIVRVHQMFDMFDMIVEPSFLESREVMIDKLKYACDQEDQKG